MKRKELIGAYDAPEIDIVLISVENGFADSPINADDTDDNSINYDYGVEL